MALNSDLQRLPWYYKMSYYINIHRVIWLSQDGWSVPCLVSSFSPYGCNVVSYLRVKIDEELVRI
jgi:hypothetical protein